MENNSETIRGRYKIIKEISRGGMGVVYLALDLLNNKEVAVKRSFLSGAETARKGFEIEAKLLARLNHERLPKVLDYFFLDDNSQALVMDFVAGETLMEILESGKFRQGRGLNVLKILDWTIQILDILRYLHNFEPPIVHRDIKPNNIKLTKEGKIILLDFGLAKGSANTLVGGMSGYSPIEQIKQTGTDPRSDIYSLGTTLFHLLTGDYPMTALSRFQEIYAEVPQAGALTPKPDPQKNAREFDPQIPTMVSEIVMKAMALMPEKRFQTADEMKTEVLKAKRSLEYGLSKFGAVTNFEISDDLEKQQALIDEAEENLPAWQPTKRAEKEPEISEIFSAPIPKPQEFPKLKDTVSSEALFGESSKEQISQNNLIENISMPDTPVESPSFLPKSDETQPKRNNSKIAFMIVGASFLILLTALGISAWYFLAKPKMPEQENTQTAILNEPSSAKPEDKKEIPLQITKYGVTKNNKIFPLDEDYRFAEREKFKFNVKSSIDGFLYVISYDSNGDVGLVYQTNNYVKKDSEKMVPPNNTFEILPDTSPKISAYFVLALSNDDQFVWRMKKVLDNGKRMMKISSSEVSELIGDLNKIAEGSVNSETVKVKISEIRTK